MPTATFFRLELEKQEKIITAAKKEFSAESVQDASIANIIKEADIPRGSFYQYFSGKEDLFYYLFDLVRKKPEEQFIFYLENADGDLFQTFRDFFSYFAKLVLEGEEKEFFRSVFLHMNYTRSSRILMNDNERKARKEHMKMHHNDSREVYSKVVTTVDQKKLNVKNEREFRMLFHQLWSMLFNTINTGFSLLMMGEAIDLKLLEADFNLKINWLEYGVVKNI